MRSKIFLKSMVVFSFALLGCSSKNNINFGTAIQPADILAKDKVKIIKENFNTLVPENTMKMNLLRPSKTLWNWSDMDLIVDFAVENKMKVRGHTFLWHQQNSPFTNSLKTKEDAINLLKENITEVMTRYKGKIFEYDICNEIFEENGELRDSLWYRLGGEDIFYECFKTARQVDPSARLVLNDYNNENIGTPKADAMFNFVKKMKEKNIPIDAVGFQLHLCTEYGLDEAAVRKNIQRYAALGVDVVFTEIDIRLKLTDKEAQEKVQSGMFKTLMNIVLTEPNVDTFMVWGYTDATNWVPKTFPNYGSATLFDKNYEPKPILDELKKMMKQRK